MSAIVHGMAATIQEGNARLRRLAAHLFTIPGHRFDYAWWVGPDWQGKEDLSCGTTACALGWGTTMPELRELGVRLFKRSPISHGFPHSSSPLSFVGLRAREHLFEPGTQIDAWREACHVALEVFALDEDETMLLFSPSDDPDETHKPDEHAHPVDVAKHIENFVAMREQSGEHVDIFAFAETHKKAFSVSAI